MFYNNCIMPKTKNIIIFFGPPGSGKGTQAMALAKRLKIPTISLGELFRTEINKKTKLGNEVAVTIAKGKLVKEKIVETIIDQRLARQDVKNGFILDGYPRNEKQNKELIKKIKKFSNKETRAILVNVSDKEVKRRLGGRRICVCGRNYHLLYKPPKKKDICDKCGKKLLVRKDDKPMVIASRLKFYHQEIRPILAYWKKSGKLLKINGEQDIKKVEEEIINKLKSKNKK